MIPRRLYLVGFALVGLVGALVVWLVGPELKDEIAWGVLIGLLVQAPLGWLTIRSIGTRRFLPVWVGGMAIRLGVLAGAGLVLVPAFGWEMAPMLVALLVTMVALLVIEVLTAMREQTRASR